MSETEPGCNFCHMKSFETRAAAEGKKAVRFQAHEGVDIHIVADGEKLHVTNWRGWLNKIPDRCICSANTQQK